MDGSSSSQPKEPELCCLVCDYNLTGLPENRCPECGEPFDPEELRERVKSAPRRISLFGAVVLFAWPAGLFFLATLFARAAGIEWLYGTILVSPLIVIPMNAGYGVTRVLATHRRWRRRSPYARYAPRQYVPVFVLFTLIQLTISYGGFIGAISILY